jgi:alkylated DNA nucleotide flippase Atl1
MTFLPIRRGGVEISTLTVVYLNSFSLRFSARSGGDYLQKTLLEREGIQFTPANRIDLKIYRWQAPLD